MHPRYYKPAISKLMGLLLLLPLLIDTVKAQSEIASTDDVPVLTSDYFHVYIDTETHQPYSLALTNPVHFIQMNYQIISDTFYKNYLEIYQSLPSELARVCGGVFSHRYPVVYSHVANLGEGKIGMLNFQSSSGVPGGIRVKTYLGILMHGSSASRNLTFERCVENFTHNVIQDLKNLHDQQSWGLDDFKSIVYLVLSLELIFITTCVAIYHPYIKLYLHQLYLDHFPFVFNEKFSINESRVKTLGLDEETIPPEYICLITSEIMDEPVRTCDSIPSSGDENFDKHPSYEKSQIQNWLKRYNYPPHNPAIQLLSKKLTPDVLLKSKIENFIRTQESLFARKKEETKHEEPILGLHHRAS